MDNGSGGSCKVFLGTVFKDFRTLQAGRLLVGGGAQSFVLAALNTNGDSLAKHYQPLRQICRSLTCLYSSSQQLQPTSSQPQLLSFFSRSIEVCSSFWAGVNSRFWRHSFCFSALCLRYSSSPSSFLFFSLDFLFLSAAVSFGLGANNDHFHVT